MEPRVYTCDPRVCTVAVARAIDTRSGRLILEGSFPEMDHPTAGRHRVTGTPVKLSATPGASGEPAPLLGQHTHDVLRELLGLDTAAFDSLAEREIVYQTETLRSST